MKKRIRAAVFLALLSGCGNPVERDIARLVAGGDQAEQARMSLVLAKSSAVLPLIHAFQRDTYPSRARVDIAEVLYRLYLREADPRLLEALLGGLADPDAAVRGRVARALGDLHHRQAIGALIGQLEQEDDPLVRQEILIALEIIGMEEAGRSLANVPVRTDLMSDAERNRFTRRLRQLAQQAQSDSLQRRVLEWLEVLAEEKAVQAETRLLAGDLSGAESLLLAARDLVPDSRNIAHRLGRFYFDTGQQARGLQILSAAGLVLRVPRLRQAPRIDGELDDPAWKGLQPLQVFYQCIAMMRAWPTEARTEAYVGYLDNRLYIGVQGYGIDGDSLVARITQRDEDVWQDDCVEVFLDADHDYRTYHQIIANSLGTLMDVYYDGNTPAGDRSWDSDCRVATRVSPSSWSAEFEIPAGPLHQGPITPGRIWGFNLARVRIQAAEYGQWAPTYGSALRPDRFGFLVFE